MERVVVVALGDRKYVKLQRSAILMIPNDMPPLSAATTDNGESVVSVPTKRKQDPARADSRTIKIRPSARSTGEPDSRNRH